MKDLERKQNLAKWGCNSNNSERQRQHLPLNLAAREAYFKGSLLDRVASLENRLFQVIFNLIFFFNYRNNTTDILWIVKLLISGQISINFMFGSNSKRSGKRISLESDRIDLFSYIYICQPLITKQVSNFLKLLKNLVF